MSHVESSVYALLQLNLFLTHVGTMSWNPLYNVGFLNAADLLGFHYTLNYINNYYCIAVSLRFLIKYYKSRSKQPKPRQKLNMPKNHNKNR
jgi:hypothetical protein